MSHNNIWRYIHCSLLLHRQIDGLVQDCSNSSANALELLQSGTKPSRWFFQWKFISPGYSTIWDPPCVQDPLGYVRRSPGFKQGSTSSYVTNTWIHNIDMILTHLPLDKMAAISQPTFSNAFSFKKISLKLIPNGLISNILTLVQITACHLVGAKLLSEPMLTWFTDAKGRWVKLKVNKIYVNKMHSTARLYTHSNAGLILGLHPANERCCYKVTLSLIGWMQT